MHSLVFHWLFAILLCFDWLIYLFGAYYWRRATASNRMHSLSLVNFWYFHWLFAILLCSDSLIINHNYYLSSVQKTSKSDSTLKNRKSAFQLFNLRNPIFLLLRTEMSIFHYKTSDFFLLRTQIST